MHVRLEPATDVDAAAIAALRLVAARQLTMRYGKGTWSFAAESEAGVRADLMTSNVLIAKAGAKLIATLRLSTRMPWLSNVGCFTRSHRPFYLTTMAIAPRFQRHGIGRTCLEQTATIAAHGGADAIRLDAYDAPAGAGEFYRKCGFREAGRAAYNGTPLIFFELILKPPVIAPVDSIAGNFGANL